MKGDGQINEPTSDGLRFFSGEEFCPHCFPFRRDPGFVSRQKDFALVLEMLVKNACRIACFLSDPIRIRSMITDTVKEAGRSRHQSFASLLRRTAKGTVSSKLLF